LLDDYKELMVVGARFPDMKLPVADKGHKAELRRFAASILEGEEWPIPLWQQVETTRISLEVEDQINA
ncbi:MAG TPA: hypothetical protein VGS41_16870, partial [Chthonomonadales bacterium]|nr:hypothetical protein [Chthonomonadales bacterium]